MFKKIVLSVVLSGSGVVSAAQEQPVAVEKITADKVISTYDERVQAAQKEQFSSTVAFGLFSVAWAAFVMNFVMNLESARPPYEFFFKNPNTYGMVLCGPILVAFVAHIRRCYKIAKKYDLKVPADAMIDYWTKK